MDQSSSFKPATDSVETSPPPDPAGSANATAKTEPWWTDARKVLVTQILTLLLTPVSVAVTFFLTEYYKSPKARVEYVTSSIGHVWESPSTNFVTKIAEEPLLALNFREILLRRASAQNQPAPDYARWLDTGEWDTDYNNVYKGALNEMESLLVQQRNQLSFAHGALAAIKVPEDTNATASIDRSLNVVNEFRAELKRIEDSPHPRSGSVSLTVGILNAGASDGTVFKEAMFGFDGKTITAHASKYTPIPSHGFAEVTFELPYEQDGEVIGTYTVGEEDLIKQWSKLVRSGMERSYELRIVVSDKPAPLTKGTLDAE